MPREEKQGPHAQSFGRAFGFARRKSRADQIESAAAITVSAMNQGSLASAADSPIIRQMWAMVTSPNTMLVMRRYGLMVSLRDRSHCHFVPHGRNLKTSRETCQTRSFAYV